MKRNMQQNKKFIDFLKYKNKSGLLLIISIVMSFVMFTILIMFEMPIWPYIIIGLIGAQLAILVDFYQRFKESQKQSFKIKLDKIT